MSFIILNSQDRHHQRVGGVPAESPPRPLQVLEVRPEEGDAPDPDQDEDRDQTQTTAEEDADLTM